VPSMCRTHHMRKGVEAGVREAVHNLPVHIRGAVQPSGANPKVIQTSSLVEPKRAVSGTLNRSVGRELWGNFALRIRRAGKLGNCSDVQRATGVLGPAQPLTGVST
jgi:hypothetical protein